MNSVTRNIYDNSTRNYYPISKLQEYFLGYRTGDKSSVFAPVDSLAKPPAILLGEVLYPYYTINFTDGTTCDLTNTHRMSSVLYICLEEEDGRIIQVSEVESCHYQLVFATKSLCANAAYRIPKRPVHFVSCVPRSDAPNKPGALVAFEEDQKKLNFHGVSNLAALLGRLEFQNIQVEAEHKNNMLIYRIRTVDPASQSQAKPDDFSDGSMESEEEPNQAASQITKVEQFQTEIKKLGESSQMRTSTFLAFLQGRFCLTGMMTGWWNHEICFNKNVTQYHVDDHGSRSQSILLGEWNREAHEKWAEQQSLKKDHSSKPPSRILKLFYGNGDFCEEIKAKREVVVKMRCEQSAAGIHLSFAESSVCRYSVLIESATFCDFPDDGFDGLTV
ncbi:Endoplasmic reticulum lectin [Paragonimus heterotremus]|uniref:Endoplasmic reticulum lectin 1 n=1 Tax=Paragonimus heterotremus TaxID=100268 RepID=A0A8J4T4X1_9TREM|nr:Endoplasmic reticulum lectin [Paragonimus heterotremus]